MLIMNLDLIEVILKPYGVRSALIPYSYCILNSNINRIFNGFWYAIFNTNFEKQPIQMEMAAKYIIFPTLVFNRYNWDGK